MNPLNRPLTERLRPRSIYDVVGQQHLVGPGKPLRTVFETGRLHSMILYGPPGTGKTSLARLLLTLPNHHVFRLSAVETGVKEVRDAIKSAMIDLHSQRQVVIFLDEVHNFNRHQQDIFLPYIEDRQIIFVGATTENPSFKINRALLSRVRLYNLQPLQREDLNLLIDRALKEEDYSHLQLSDDVREFILTYADYDARRLINLLEQVFQEAIYQEKSQIDLEIVKNIVKTLTRSGDNKGDIFYELISAFHKSVRGSHPNAALYWFERMRDAGMPMDYILRRLVVIAWEDISLADPHASIIALNAAQTYERIGEPEGILAVANAVIYLACAPKSNSAYMALNRVQEFVANHSTEPVPLHLRNAPTKLMKEMDFGKGYRYAHDEPYAYAAGEKYMPLNMNEPLWYLPSDRGYEVQIRSQLQFLSHLDRMALDPQYRREVEKNLRTQQLNVNKTSNSTIGRDQAKSNPPEEIAKTSDGNITIHSSENLATINNSTEAFYTNEANYIPQNNMTEKDVSPQSHDEKNG